MSLKVKFHSSVRYPLDRGTITQVARQFLRFMAIPEGNYLLEVDIVSSSRSQALNHQYRGKDAPTDVLSFPIHPHLPPGSHSQPILLGSVVICPELANLAETTIIDLVVHGLLHLIGWDHESESESRRWQKTVTQFQVRLKGDHLSA